MLIAPVLALSMFVTATKPMSAADQIRAADEAWVSTMKHNDIDRYLTFYTADAKVFPPSEAILDTPEKIKNEFESMKSLKDLKMTWTCARVTVAKSGDLGYTYGFYTMSFVGPDGKAVSDRGKTLEVWRKQQDGSWKCEADIWNSDGPQQG